MPSLYKYIPYKPSLQYRAVSGRKEDEDPLVRAWIRGQIPALRESIEAEKAFDVEEAGRTEQKRQFGKTMGLRRRELSLARERQAEEEKQGKVSLGITGASTAATTAALTKGSLWGKKAATTGLAATTVPVKTGTGGAMALSSSPALAVNAPEAAAGAGATGAGTTGGASALGTIGSYVAPAAVGFGLGATLGKSGTGRDIGQFLMGQHGGEQEHAAVTGGVSGALAGAAIGSVVPVLGTAIGAVVGGIAGIVGGGCIIFGYLYGDRSPQARYAKVFCGRHMDLPTLLGYYQLGEKIIHFWEKHPAFIKPMERLLVRPFYDYMLWKLKRKKKISLWAKVWSKFWLKLCKESEKRRKEPMFIPSQYNPCIQVVGGNHA